MAQIILDTAVFSLTMKHLPETHLISHLIVDKRRECYKYTLFTAKNINSAYSQY